MSDITSFQDQKQQDGKLTLLAMATSLGINAGTALAVVIGFSFFRPKHTWVYAPKLKKYLKSIKCPPMVRPGFFDWVIPLDKYDLDDSFIKIYGEDTTLFLRFLRRLRLLFLPLGAIGCILMVINVFATKATGDWPPAAGLEIFSMSGINYHNGQLNPSPDTRWYIPHTLAIYLISFLVGFSMHYGAKEFKDMRRKYFERLINDNSEDDVSNVLLVRNIPEGYRSNKALKEWFSKKSITVQKALIGHNDPRLKKLLKERKGAVHELENYVAGYLGDGTKTKKNRPIVRVDKEIFFFGGKKVDAISFYTDKAESLETEINAARNRSKKEPTNYGWVFFEDATKTAEAVKLLRQEEDTADSLQDSQWIVRSSPPQTDLIWSNLSLGEKVRKSKRLIGQVIFWVFVFVWMLPIGALSATSNLVNLVRLFPNSNIHIDQHGFFMSMFQTYFTPILMAIFFFVLPIIFRFISKQQGYISESTLDRKVFTKLYIFFIINNLLIFTLSTMLISIFGQIKSLITSGSLQDNVQLSDYATQLAKNISDVSTYWINYVCIKGLGLTMELAQIFPLVYLTLRKLITKPSPKKLIELTEQPFDYPGSYNILMFFFTIALVYSVIAPLVLPFALIYYCISSVIYKYMLMYMYTTERESGGRIWPAISQAVMTSVILFQVIMIIILRLKGGYIQCYVLIPLPFITLAFQIYSHRQMRDLGSYTAIKSRESDDGSKHANGAPNRHNTKFHDPDLDAKLSKPLVYRNVEHLVEQLYEPENESHMGPDDMELNNKVKSKSNRASIYADNRKSMFCFISEEDIMGDKLSPDFNAVDSSFARCSREESALYEDSIHSDTRLTYIDPPSESEHHTPSSSRQQPYSITNSYVPSYVEPPSYRDGYDSDADEHSLTDHHSHMDERSQADVHSLMDHHSHMDERSQADDRSFMDKQNYMNQRNLMSRRSRMNERSPASSRVNSQQSHLRDWSFYHTSFMLDQSPRISQYRDNVRYTRGSQQQLPSTRLQHFHDIESDPENVWDNDSEGEEERRDTDYSSMWLDSYTYRRSSAPGDSFLKNGARRSRRSSLPSSTAAGQLQERLFAEAAQNTYDVPSSTDFERAKRYLSTMTIDK